MQAAVCVRGVWDVMPSTGAEGSLVPETRPDPGSREGQATACEAATCDHRPLGGSDHGDNGKGADGDKQTLF